MEMFLPGHCAAQNGQINSSTHTHVGVLGYTVQHLYLDYFLCVCALYLLSLICEWSADPTLP
jgi:hypothetical protein